MHYNLNGWMQVWDDGGREEGIFFRSEMQSTECQRVRRILNLLLIVVAILPIRKEHYEGCSISRTSRS